jgi:hypothetical protein
MWISVVLGALFTLGPSPVGFQANGAGDGRLTCTAFAASTGGPRTAPVATAVDISVERWSTEGERRRLVETFKQDQEALLEQLRDLPRVGYIRTPSALGWNLHYAHARPADEGGQHVVIATDRPISIWEAVNQPRSIDYPFTFIELHLDAEGQGEGKLSLATRVIPSRDGASVQLENYAAQPVQLNNVKCR